MADKAVKRRASVPWFVKKHNQIVKKLNEHPDWWDLKLTQRKRSLLMSIKPFLYELVRTRQISRSDIRQAILDTGYKISERELDHMIDRLGWQHEQEIGAKHKPSKPLRWNAINAAILEVGRHMPPHEMDPRIALRYYELTNLVPVETSANFLRTTDIINSIERKAREAWSEGKNIEQAFSGNAIAGEPIPAEIRDDVVIEKWVRFV